MSIIDRLKDLKDQLPKTKLEEKVQKENNNLTELVNNEIKPKEEEEPTVHPGMGPAKEDYICLNTFSVQFQQKETSFIDGSKVFAVGRPDYDIINSREDNEIKITFALVDAKHYFGKPSEYTNFKTDQEVYDLIQQFNQDPPEWMEFVEYGDESELPRLTTRYYGLNISRIQFPEYNVQDNSMKYYTATLSFDRKRTYHGEYEEIVE